MDAEYWKEFKDMGESSGSEEETKSSYDGKYPEKDVCRRSHSGSRSPLSSNLSCFSSRPISSSSRHRTNDRKYPGRNRFNKESSSYGRNARKRDNYNRDGCEDGTWVPPHRYPNQGPDIPPSTFIPQELPQAPLNIPGQYTPNFQGPFGRNYHPPIPTFDSGTPNFFPPNFPPQTGLQPPHQEYPIGGGPPWSLGPPVTANPPANWELFPDAAHPPLMMQVPGEAIGALPIPVPDLKTEEAKKEAIEHELLQLKKTLSVQREDYVRRKFSLNKELNRLKDHKRDLMKEKSKENERILRENAKFQEEYQEKLKSIDNVIEMLTNLIGDSFRLPDVINEIKNREKKKSSDKSKKPIEKRKHSPISVDSRRRSISTEKVDTGEDFYDSDRTYYDPGLYWCSECNVFPKTINEYLKHLHSAEHKEKSKMKSEDYPWHAGENLKEKSPQLSKDSLPKRKPIRGAQFLVPAMAWFCSICKTWLGDSHCASKHLQSYNHTDNYNEFIKKRPHYEVDWLTERSKSYEVLTHRAENRKVSHDRDLMRNDHDEAVISAKQSTNIDPKRKNRNNDELKYFRHSKRNRESPKDRRPNYDVKYKSKYEKEGRDDSKHKKDFLEREINKKHPFSKMKDDAEKNSNDDIRRRSLEKRISESAAKENEGKKSPKTKLPFIGRMPILKKVELKPEEKYERKGQDGCSTQANISDSTNLFDKLPKSILTIDGRPHLAEPGIAENEILFNNPATNRFTEQDNTGVPKEKKTPKYKLDEDFKTTLALLFPEEKNTPNFTLPETVVGQKKLNLPTSRRSPPKRRREQAKAAAKSVVKNYLIRRR